MLGFCATYERDCHEREQRDRKRALAWEFLSDIYQATEAGNLIAQTDLMVQLALVTEANWYLEREGASV